MILSTVPMSSLFPVPKLDIRPRDAKIATSAVGGVSSKFVIEAASRSVVITEHLLAIHVNAEALQVGIVHRVNADASTDRGHTVGNRLAALDAVKATALLHGHDEIRARVSVESLLDGNSIARHGIDPERAAELVRARRVVVLVSAFGAKMAIGAAGASSAAIGAFGDGKGVAADFAAFALLCAEAGVVLDPVAVLYWAPSEGQRGSRDGKKKTFDKHFLRRETGQVVQMDILDPEDVRRGCVLTTQHSVFVRMLSKAAR